MLKKLSLIVVSAVSAFAMHNAEININDKDLEIGAKFDLGQFSNTVAPDTTYLGMTYLSGSEDNSNSNIDGYVEANFLMKQEIDNTGLLFGIGLKANYTQVNGNKFITVPLGLELGYSFLTRLPVTIGTEFYYAPESLAFAKAENFLEYRFTATLEVIDKGSLVVGYRTIDTNIENRFGSQTYNQSAYFGFKFSF